MTSIFWLKDPSVLMDKNNMLELWPLSKMNTTQKLNAISRLVIVLTILGVLVTRSLKILFSGIITLLIIVLMDSLDNKSKRENFSISDKKNMKVNGKELSPFLEKKFYPTKDKNVTANVLLPQIKYDPQRKPAPPSFNNEVYGDINQQMKKNIQKLNPGIKDTDEQLFGDLGENFEFDQSMRSFYSMPSTQIPNDQSSFANYLYGDMPSCRDGNGIACVKNTMRYNLY